LLASKINRAHSALQESLSLATAMIDLIKPCSEVGISPEVAIHLEAANSLWDQGEMASSIGMLQGLDNAALLKTQTITIGRSELLSKIGYQVSVARLEKADKVIDKFLKPALKDLKGTTSGTEAGQVFHQFAMFCDQQLQDPDSVEDLERLKKLRKNKANEVKEYENLIHRASTSADKTRYKGLQNKAKIWLKLDDEELQRHNQSREEFLRQCLENYLLALAASDDHDSNALRFSALWLEHSEEKLANDAVSKHLSHVPSRKFASLMNQLSSRLQNSDVEFQHLLFALVLRICTEHPLHGMYQMYAGIKSRINEKDESAVSRRAATIKVVQGLDNTPNVKEIWTAVDRTNKYYCALAQEKDEQRYKAGRKISVNTSRAAQTLNKAMSTYGVPPPTMPLTLHADMDYSRLPIMTRLEPQFSIASGVSAPKIITVMASNGVKYKQLV
jgi:ataxia telangiectasia mutated family protein